MRGIFKTIVFIVVVSTGFISFYIVATGIKSLLISKEILFPLLLFFLSVPSFIYNLKSVKKNREDEFNASKSLLDYNDSAISNKPNAFLLIFNCMFGLALFGSLTYLIYYVFIVKSQPVSFVLSDIYKTLVYLLIVFYILAGLLIALDSMRIYKKHIIDFEK